MSATFAANLLRTGASGYAGVAASMLLERQSDLEERFGPDALGRWKDNLQQRLLELASALDADSPEAFAARMRWTAVAFDVRGIDGEDLQAGLDCLADALADNLPPFAVEVVAEYFAQARAALTAPGDAPASELDPSDAEDRRVLEYLSAALEGRPAEAIAIVTDAAAGDLGVRGAYDQIVHRAQVEIGRLWFMNEASVLDEHLVTQTSERATAALSRLAEPGPATGKTIIVAAVETNAHALGARFVADFFQMEGWRTIFLGADTPARDIADATKHFDADVLALSASVITQLNRVASTISLVRAEGKPGIKILVGGRAFEDAPEAWERFGADAHPLTAAEAVERARELLSA